MSKPKSIFSCQQCGFQSTKWMGRCPDCNQWNTLSEEIISHSVSEKKTREITVTPLSQIKIHQTDKISTGFLELDRVLGGGIFKGAVTLIAGDPGIGKSTLLLQVSNELQKRNLKILYLSGEESELQIKNRAERLKINSDKIILSHETNLETILVTLQSVKPDLVIIDSIQTISTDEFKSTPGSVTQIRESTSQLIDYCKSINLPLFLIGHITKEGAIAGPKILEHMVDTVLYFEGDSSSSYRMLRSFKNRFGSTNEVAVFEMNFMGLHDVKNPSAIFLSEHLSSLPGVSIIPPMEGTRVFLVEAQSLVGVTNYPIPKRATVGIDTNKISILAAILEKKSGLRFMDKDIFINITGGFKILDPGCDLGIATSIASSYFNKPVPSQLVSIGELSLTGEVRNTSQLFNRIKEANKFGFNKFILSEEAKKLQPQLQSEFKGIEYLFIRHINDLYDKIF